jgi:hypothetical protein
MINKVPATLQVGFSDNYKWIIQGLVIGLPDNNKKTCIIFATN